MDGGRRDRETKMTKDASDNGRVLDMGDDAHAAFTNRTGQHINAEDAHHEGGPGETATR